MTQALSRTVSARLFKGTEADESGSGPWGLVGQVFDRVNMPALVMAAGDYCSYSGTFTGTQSTDALNLIFPQNKTASSLLYIAIIVSNRVGLSLVSPTIGTGKVLLEGTNDSAAGVHPGLWVYQGDITSIQLTRPSTANGGVVGTSFSVFSYIIPDLDDAENYYDKELALGHA